MNVAYVYPGQGMNDQGMGLPLVKDKFLGRIVKPMLKLANEIGGDTFSLEHNLEYTWKHGNDSDLKDPLVTHLSVFTLCKAVQAGLEQKLEEKRVKIDESYCAGLSMGRKCVLPFNEHTLRLMGLRGLELKGTPEGSKEMMGWKKSLLNVDPGFKLDPSGYSLVTIIGLDDLTVEEICQETGAKISNHNARNIINISGANTNLARATDFLKVAGGKIINQQLQPFHNYVLMAGFEQAFGDIAIAEKSRYNGQRLPSKLISDSDGGFIRTYKTLLEDAGRHGRYVNRFVDAAKKIEDLDATVIVIAFSERSAKGMKTLLGPKKRDEAILAYDPHSIDSAVEKLAIIHKEGRAQQASRSYPWAARTRRSPSPYSC